MPRCLMLLLFVPLLVAAGPARGDQAVPDSLPELRNRLASGRPGDPAIVALAERIVARREQARRARPSDVAEAVEWLGRVRLGRVEYAAADSLFRRALVLRRTEPRADSLAMAGTIAWLAEAQRVEKQLARAESTATEGLALTTRLAARDTALEARLRITLGNVFAERGQADRAVEELVRAVRLTESRVPADSLLLGQAYRNLARARSLAGDRTGAAAAYARAAAIQESSLGPEHPELGTTLFLSAMLASTQGDYVAQRRFAERALAIREHAFGPTHPAVAITAATLGGALRNLGDPEGAMPLYERALAIARGAARPSAFDLALALNNLGSAALMVGDGARARACLEEARAVRDSAFGPGAGRSLWSGTRLAQAMAMTGELSAAAIEIDQALALVDSTNYRDAVSDLPDAIGVKAEIEWSSGHVPQALAACDRSYALADSLFGASSPHTLDALAGRASMRALVGRFAEAWADARQLEATSREVLRLSARSLAEHEALTLERSRASGLDVMLALAGSAYARAPQLRVELADAVVRARLLVLDQLADERRTLPRDAPALAAPVRELESARDALARAMVEALREDRALDSTVTNARMRREAAERALAAQSEGFELGLRRSDAGFADVAAALPRGSVLVSFVRHDAPVASLREGPVADSLRLALRGYSAIVQRAGEVAPVIVPLGPAARLETAVARWLEACATPPGAAAVLASAAERRCNALGRTVRARVWDPLAPHLAGATRIFVVPDGVLHAVNFAALPLERAGYVVDGAATVHRLGAERDLLSWSADARPGRGLLALGGANFEHATGDDGPTLAAAVADGTYPLWAGPPDSSRLRFPPLPQTAAEVAQVVALWRASPSPDAGMADALTDGEASESAFERLAPGRRVLHLATHGFALGGATARPAFPGARGVGALVSGAPAAALRHGPALLPGLALAGANMREYPGRTEDGFLTAEEITSLDLTGAEWAVLSACETGLSDPGAPEAVQGLQRAFRRAGVRAVIMSLWAVDDEATRAWMAQLYTARLLRGRDTAESVRAASREILRERRARGLDTHPFHWAAFVAAGDWR